jgi:hypothetical protein
MPNAQIARQHSFAGAAYSIPGVEDKQALDNLRADLIAVYQPVNSQELFAVERIALAQLSLLRAARLEAGIFSVMLGQTAGLDSEGADDAADPLSAAFRGLAGKSAVMPLFLRYQAQAERHYRRAIEEFKRLKNLRKELPNQLAGGPQPDPPHPQPQPKPQPAAAATPIRSVLPHPPTPPLPATPSPRPLVHTASPAAAVPTPAR